MLCSLPPAMLSQLECLGGRSARGGCWSKSQQVIQTRGVWTDHDTKYLTILSSPTSLSLVYVCRRVCACMHVCPSYRSERSTSNRDLPKPRSLKEKTPRCSAPKGQPNVTCDLFRVHRNLGTFSNGFWWWWVTFELLYLPRTYFVQEDTNERKDAPFREQHYINNQEEKCVNKSLNTHSASVGGLQIQLTHGLCVYVLYF